MTDFEEGIILEQKAKARATMYSLAQVSKMLNREVMDYLNDDSVLEKFNELDWCGLEITTESIRGIAEGLEAVLNRRDDIN